METKLLNKIKNIFKKKQPKTEIEKTFDRLIKASNHLSDICIGADYGWKLEAEYQRWKHICEKYPDYTWAEKVAVKDRFERNIKFKEDLLNDMDEDFQHRFVMKDLQSKIGKMKKQ